VYHLCDMKARIQIETRQNKLEKIEMS